MIRGPKKLPPDTTWPPAGVRDLKPEFPVRDSADRVRFPTVREAFSRVKMQAPTRAQDIPDVSPDTLTAQCVLDMRRRTRSRIVEYLCRAYLQFGHASMLAKDLQQLCAAINAERRL